MKLNTQCIILRIVKHILLVEEDKISTMNVVHLEGGGGGVGGADCVTRKGQMRLGRLLTNP